MTFAKIFIVLIFFSFTTQVTQNNVLELKKKPHFTESISCSRTIENNIQIDIEVSYNSKRVVDEEYSHELRLVLPKTIIQGSVLKISSENSEAKCNYQFSSVWVWATKDRLNNMSGIIKIIRKSRNALTLHLDIIASEKNGKESIAYIGERTIHL